MLKLISFINFRKTYLRIICTAGLNKIDTSSETDWIFDFHSYNKVTNSIEK